MTNFKSIAQNELSLSELMNGREQLHTRDIVNNELTIIAFDFVTLNRDDACITYPVVLFKEMPNHYYNGGTLLSKLCQAWAAAYDGDIKAASDDLAKEGGVKVRFVETKTKNGNNLVSIAVM